MYVCFGQTKHANEQHIGAFTVPVCQLMDLLSRTFGELWKLLPLNAIRGRFTFLPGLSCCILYFVYNLLSRHIVHAVALLEEEILERSAAAPA